MTLIVPVFNAEKTISRCVSSLTAQTYKNIEILLFNDGSTDQSLEKIRAFRAQDKRIQVLSHDNCGAAATRNIGIRLAAGDYLAFVDADDCIDASSIERCLARCRAETDIVLCGLRLHSKSPGNNHVDILPIPDAWSQLKFPATAFKLYRRDFLLDNNVTFPNFVVSEDILFNLHAYACTSNVEYVSEPLYHIYEHADSTTHRAYQAKLVDILDNVLVIQQQNWLKKFPYEQGSFFLKKMIVQNALSQLRHHTVSDVARLFKKNLDYMRRHYDVRFSNLPHEDTTIKFIVNTCLMAYRCKLLTPMLWMGKLMCRFSHQYR